MGKVQSSAMRTVLCAIFTLSLAVLSCAYPTGDTLVPEASALQAKASSSHPSHSADLLSESHAPVLPQAQEPPKASGGWSLGAHTTPALIDQEERIETEAVELLATKAASIRVVHATKPPVHKIASMGELKDQLSSISQLAHGFGPSAGSKKHQQILKKAALTQTVPPVKAAPAPTTFEQLEHELSRVKKVNNELTGETANAKQEAITESANQKAKYAHPATAHAAAVEHENVQLKQKVQQLTQQQQEATRVEAENKELRAQLAALQQTNPPKQA